MSLPVARVAVSAAAFAFDRPYSYRIPPEMAVQAGSRVLVPFGRGNRPVEGVVLALAEEAEAPELKTILKLLDPEPLLSGELLRLALWMRNRFFCTVRRRQGHSARRRVVPCQHGLPSRGGHGLCRRARVSGFGEPAPRA